MTAEIIHANQALEILEELVKDVRAVGPEQVKADWPDLFTTYESAVDLLTRAGWLDSTGNPAH